MGVKLEYFHRIDPNMDVDGAKRIIAGQEADLSRLRPKARRAAEEKLAMMYRDLSKLEAQVGA